MGSLYYDLVGILRGAGLRVEVPAVCQGWERRARSSGGFSSPPVCVFWHHTASNTSPGNDLAFMINGSSDAPVGNLLIDREGVCYPIAGGASNCAGKGGPMTFSRGTVALDSGNTRGFQIEVANAGTGQAWPEVQVDALILASNALNAAVGNLPTDITSHALGAGDGYTNRKIDPATAGAVQGRWRPRSTNSSGTWSLADMRAEANARASQPGPDPAPPIPDPEEDPDMDRKLYVVLYPGAASQWLTDMATFRTLITDPGVANEGVALFGWTPGPTDGYWSLGPGWAPFLDQLPVTCP